MYEMTESSLFPPVSQIMKSKNNAITQISNSKYTKQDIYG
jgi:hypothetical protein